MARIALGVEYDGRGFRGFETQRAVRTVQSALEKAVSRVADAPIRVSCAGRTDSGVHAVGQVVHFDSTAERPDRAWLLGVTSYLPKDVTIRWVARVGQDFHARYSAFRRDYRYVVCNRATRPALLHGRVGFECRTLDAERMARAACALEGEHDFSAFRAAGCQAKHAVRTIYSISVVRSGDFVILDIAANAFLQHMVRNIVGTLLEVALGRRPEDWVKEVLQTRDRRQAGVTAAAGGLYFCRVHYPPEFGLPAGGPPEVLTIG